MSTSRDIEERTMRLSVIVITYNSSDVILECLAPLADHLGANLELIIVDNASTDGTAELVRTTFNGVTVIETGENLGFGRGVRVGIKHATGDLYCLLNPDAVATADVLDGLVEQLNDPRVGIVAPLIVQPHGRLRIVSAGAFPTDVYSLLRVVSIW
jgi:N-acetylglucosaminyl-diphospho-decaprenol L-rhamnosyltransferase